jgi:hypothetical protein
MARTTFRRLIALAWSSRDDDDNEEEDDDGAETRVGTNLAPEESSTSSDDDAGDAKDALAVVVASRHTTETNRDCAASTRRGCDQTSAATSMSDALVESEKEEDESR